MKKLRKVGKLLLIVLIAVLAIPVLLLVGAILLLLSPIPVGVRFRYHGEVSLRLIVAFFHLQLLPKKPMTRKQLARAEAKKAKKQEKKARKAAQKAEQKKKRQAHGLIARPEPETPKQPKQPLRAKLDKLEGLIPWAKLGVRFVGEFFRRRLCVRRLNVRVALANGDPARLALSTAKAWEILGVAVPILEQGFRIRERRLNVYPDFTAKKTDAEAELQIRLLLGGLFWMALRYGLRALKIFLSGKFKKKQTPPEPAEPAAQAS